jgi:hypothetical protein
MNELNIYDIQQIAQYLETDTKLISGRLNHKWCKLTGKVYMKSNKMIISIRDIDMYIKMTNDSQHRILKFGIILNSHKIICEVFKNTEKLNKIIAMSATIWEYIGLYGTASMLQYIFKNRGMSMDYIYDSSVVNVYIGAVKNDNTELIENIVLNASLSIINSLGTMVDSIIIKKLILNLLKYGVTKELILRYLDGYNKEQIIEIVNEILL